MSDDVSDVEKRRRFHLIEALHKQISTEKNRQWLGETVEVLVEDLHKDRWRGRSPQGKLVFLHDPRDLRGQVVQVNVKHTGPWSMSGTAVDRPQVEKRPFTHTDSIPLTISS